MQTEESKVISIAPLSCPHAPGEHKPSVPIANGAASSLETLGPVLPLCVLAADLQKTKVFLPPFGELSLLSLQISFVFI